MGSKVVDGLEHDLAFPDFGRKAARDDFLVVMHFVFRRCLDRSCFSRHGLLGTPVWWDASYKDYPRLARQRPTAGGAAVRYCKRPAGRGAAKRQRVLTALEKRALSCALSTKNLNGRFSFFRACGTPVDLDFGDATPGGFFKRFRVC